jgi:methyl-accepting chemotaxis protein
VFGFDGAAKKNKATLDAIGRSLAIIEFDPTGKILSANENFCKALGYQASEIIGQHHSLFVEPEFVHSSEYREFWAKLAVANSRLASISASARADGRSGFRRRTVR